MATVERANNTGRVWRITICPVPVLPLPTCFSHRTHEVCHDHRSNWWDHDKNNKNKDNYNHRMRLISEFFSSIFEHFSFVSGACTVRLEMPLDMQSALIFHYNLKFYNNDTDNYDGVSLKRFVMQVRDTIHTGCPKNRSQNKILLCSH